MKIELHNTSISTLSRNVTVRIMLPNGYEDSDKKYPVLYMHDGQDLFYDKDAVGGKSWGFGNYYNSYYKFLPEIIIVAIDCPLDRELELHNMLLIQNTLMLETVALNLK